VACYPQITRQVQRMHAWARRARLETGYQGEFVYAYATKANFSAEVVQTALAAGAHYETSSAADIEIAGYLWREGILPPERLILCNGSKEPAYLASILRLRQEGCTQLLPILDDLEEWATLRRSDQSLWFGVRERAAGTRRGSSPGNDRFGLTAAEIDEVANSLHGSPHQLVLYHAMIGSQIEDEDAFLAALHASVAAYCALRQRVPTLRYFDFGGGMPTSGYALDFAFDYPAFLRRLLACIRDTCAAYGVPVPHLVGEFGRYTVANHSLYLFEVGQTKAGGDDAPDWYLLNGSLMVSLPDMLLVPNQQFVLLPLDHWDAPLRAVRLAGRRTCDSDDVYPRPDQPPLLLPAVGQGLRLAVFGTGAYQQMLSGMGGVHHCLTPEPRRVTIRESGGQLITQSQPAQDQVTIMQLLGYQPHGGALPLRPRPQRKAS
jgi:arginine decarboxylase